MFVYACVLLFVGTASSVKIPNVKMNDGMEMPAIALGTFIGVGKDALGKPDDKQVRNAVLHAIDIGYRHIDTAYIYQTEDQVGEALKTKIEEGVVTREDMFITTKLWNIHHKREEVLLELQESLERLSLNYVNLYLMHWPLALNADYSFSDTDFMETWRGMEHVLRLGLARSIGISNFNVEQVARLLKEASVKPAAIQIEVHPTMRQTELLELCRAHNIVVMGYSPLGSLVTRYGVTFPGPKVDDPVLKAIAEKYRKTTAQVVLRWSVDRNVVPLPKSTNPDRQRENYEIFDFKLTDEEVEQINGFNTDTRLIVPSFWQEHKYYPFEKVDNPMDDPFIKKEEA